MNIEQPDFVLVVADDRLSVLLDCNVPPTSVDLLLENIESQLKALGVTSPLVRAERLGRQQGGRFGAGEKDEFLGALGQLLRAAVRGHGISER